MKRGNELSSQWMKNSAFKAKYDALEEAFAIASILIQARKKLGCPKKIWLKVW